MRKQRTPSERFLKKHFDIKSKDEFETALADIPQSRFDFLAMHIAETNRRLHLRVKIARTIQILKTGSEPKQKAAIGFVMKYLLSKIDSDSLVLNEARSITGALAPFTSGAYFVSDATRVLLKENREDRRALTQMVELLFEGNNTTSYFRNLNSLLFYNAKVGDEVCIVSEFTGNFEFDSILDVFFADDTKREKYIHLKKSKIVLSEKDKYLLYRRDDSLKLQYVLKKHSLSRERGWERQIPELLKGDNNAANPLPVPRYSFS